MGTISSYNNFNQVCSKSKDYESHQTVDIQFSAHDAFLEKLPAGMLKSERIESQIICKFDKTSSYVYLTFNHDRDRMVVGSTTTCAIY